MWGSIKAKLPTVAKLTDAVQDGIFAAVSGLNVWRTASDAKENAINDCFIAACVTSGLLIACNTGMVFNGDLPALARGFAGVGAVINAQILPALVIAVTKFGGKDLVPDFFRAILTQVGTANIASLVTTLRSDKSLSEKMLTAVSNIGMAEFAGTFFAAITEAKHPEVARDLYMAAAVGAGTAAVAKVALAFASKPLHGYESVGLGLAVDVRQPLLREGSSSSHLEDVFPVALKPVSEVGVESPSPV